MQFKEILILVITIVLLCPTGKILAQNQHFSQDSLKQDVIFSSEDKQINFTIPGGRFSTIDAYLLPNAAVLPDNLTALTPVYQFYLNLNNEALALNNQQCEPYLKNYLAAGKKNTAAEIKKLQQFLKEIAGFTSVQLTGKYDKITTDAVIAFQEKYKAEILKPWGLFKGNGSVLKTTLKKINELWCLAEQERKNKITISYAYSTDPDKNLLPRPAKTFYYLTKTGEWQALNSIDNHKKGAVTAFTTETDLTFMVAEEQNQWVGEASWYAYKNGNFAASRDFPKGTQIKITNQAVGANQGKSVIVTINDYGPELKTNRIIDLDKIAFKKIGNLADGVMPVKIEVINIKK